MSKLVKGMSIEEMEDLFTPYEVNWVKDPGNDLDDFCTAILETLRLWLYQHTDPHTWAWGMFRGFTIDYLLENWNQLMNLPVIGFCPDISVLYKALAKDWFICTGCGSVWHDQESCYNCEDADEDKSDLDEIAFKLEMAGVVPDEWELASVLTGPVFDEYQDCVRGLISGVIDDVEEHIERIEMAGDNYALMSACLAALEVAHAHGEVISDYADSVGADPDIFLTVREQGLTAQFDEDYLREWLKA